MPVFSQEESIDKTKTMSKTNKGKGGKIDEKKGLKNEEISV